MNLLAPLIGVVIGLALGMLGGGGSILTVPALVYLLGQDAHAAVGTSLAIVGTNALIGAWMHSRHGHVRLRAALLFGVVGLGAAYAGARLSRLLPSALLLVLFAGLMLVIAMLMLRGGAPQAHERQAPATWMSIVLGGVAVGFLTGFLGVGGGFLIVPALVFLLGMNMRDAVGSSLVVISLNSAAGLLGHLGDGGLDWMLILVIIAGGLLGLRVGSALARTVPVGRLRQGFAGMVVVLAVVLLAINVPLLIA